MLYNKLARNVMWRKNMSAEQFANFGDSWEEQQKFLLGFLPFNPKVNELSTGEKLVIDFSHYVIDEYGYGEGYADFTATITPSLTFGFRIRIKYTDKVSQKLAKKYDLSEFIYDSLYQAASVVPKDK